MPILTITIAEGLVDAISRTSEETSEGLLELIHKHLAPAAGTEQIMFVPSIGKVVGCSILTHLVHRASDSRTAEIRKACADAICAFLAEKYDCSVRVRLIATQSSDIAAADIFKESGDE